VLVNPSARVGSRVHQQSISSAYERVLIELDRIHGDESPAIDSDGLTEDRAILLAVATSALEELEQYGVDPLSVELILAMLDDASALDGT
jgi:hypothetical protein